MDFQIKERYDINDLIKIVEMLRDPVNGCPWDKVQTHLSIRKNFIEETYEAIEAIDLDDKELMQEELGDVLMQVMLHAQFEAEENVFDFADVVNGTAQKLVLRHPHIFAGYDNKTVDGVLQKWEEIKQQEKGQKTVTETLMPCQSLSLHLCMHRRYRNVQRQAVLFSRNRMKLWKHCSRMLTA